MTAGFLHELQARGIRTSIDLVSEDSDHFDRIVPAALQYTNYCIINDFEAEKVSACPLRGASGINTASLRPAGEALFALGSTTW